VWPRKRAPRRPPHHQARRARRALVTLRPARSNRVILSPFPRASPFVRRNPTTSLPATRAFNSSHRPKPRRPIPQERAPSKPAFRRRAHRAQLAGGTPRCGAVVWTVSFPSSVHTVLGTWFGPTFSPSAIQFSASFFALDLPLCIPPPPLLS
jgi:hypothetical protein